jgi:hypothetical protein
MVTDMDPIGHAYYEKYINSQITKKFQRPKHVDGKDATKKNSLFQMWQGDHVAKEWREARPKITTISPTHVKKLEILIKEKWPSFKRGDRVLVNLSLKMLVAEGASRLNSLLLTRLV